MPKPQKTQTFKFIHLQYNCSIRLIRWIPASRTFDSTSAFHLRIPSELSIPIFILFTYGVIHVQLYNYTYTLQIAHFQLQFNVSALITYVLYVYITWSTCALQFAKSLTLLADLNNGQYYWIDDPPRLIFLFEGRTVAIVLCNYSNAFGLHMSYILGLILLHLLNTCYILALVSQHLNCTTFSFTICIQTQVTHQYLCIDVIFLYMFQVVLDLSLSRRVLDLAKLMNIYFSCFDDWIPCISISSCKTI